MKHRHLRLDLKNRVELIWNDSKKRADLENISFGGALVRANFPVRIGDHMAVHLESPSWPLAVEMGGDVVRLGRTRRGMPAFALKFRTIPEALKMFLHHILVTRRAIAV